MIISNSLGYPLCNSLGSLLHPVDSTGYRVVEKTVVLEVDNYEGYTGSASVNMYGYGGTPVTLTAESPLSAAKSSIINVPETASWNIDIFASTQSFEHSATGALDSSYIYSDYPIVSGISYSIPSSAPDTIRLCVKPLSSTGFTIVQTGLSVPDRYLSGYPVVKKGVPWVGDLVVPDTWSANSALSGLLGFYNSYYSANHNAFYSANHYCINVVKFDTLQISIDGRYRYDGTHPESSCVRAEMCRLNSNDASLVTIIYDREHTTGTSIENFHLFAHINTSNTSMTTKPHLALVGSMSGKSGESGTMWNDAKWGFTGVVK